jgi:hypothetical protein
MDRQLYENLVQWKTSARRKPLLLRGARQTGKTYLREEIAKQEKKPADMVSPWWNHELKG